jgi:DNA polymerase
MVMFCTEEIRNCKLCPLSSLTFNVENNKQNGKVFGSGEINSIMLIAQNPSFNRTDENCREAFRVRSTSDFFSDCLSLAGINRNEIYVTNVVKCSTSNNDYPTPETVECCKKWLLQEIEYVKPTCIVAMGRLARDFFGCGIEPRCKWNGYEVIAIWHPSFVKRQMGMKDKYIEQIKRVKQYVDSI